MEVALKPNRVARRLHDKQLRSNKMRDYAVILGIWKENEAPDENKIVLEGKAIPAPKPKGSVQQFVFKQASHSAAEAVGVVCMSLWSDANQKQAMALIMGCGVMEWKAFEEYNKKAKEAIDKKEEDASIKGEKRSDA